MSQQTNIIFRATAAQKQKLATLAAAYKVTPSVLLRCALTDLIRCASGLLSPAALADAQGVLANVAVALNLPKDSAPSEVFTAIQKLVDDIGEPATDPTTPGADPAPAIPNPNDPRAVKLSVRDLVALSKMTVPAAGRFIALRRERAITTAAKAAKVTR